VSIKLEHDLDEKLTEYARTRRVSRSAVVREALRAYTAPRKHSALDLAGNLVGSLSAPRDLSTNKQRLKGFGE
jgi:metal-responsive CopG/Arc/MetJ family transcriptional regulator